MVLRYKCEHMRSLYYFIESVNPDCKFTAKFCKNWKSFKNDDCERCRNGCQNIGYNLSHDADGEYYLRTGSKYPYWDN